jgi:hypothetical protein
MLGSADTDLLKAVEGGASEDLFRLLELPLVDDDAEVVVPGFLAREDTPPLVLAAEGLAVEVACREMDLCGAGRDGGVIFLVATVLLTRVMRVLLLELCWWWCSEEQQLEAEEEMEAAAARFMLLEHMEE